MHYHVEEGFEREAQADRTFHTMRAAIGYFTERMDYHGYGSDREAVQALALRHGLHKRAETATMTVDLHDGTYLKMRSCDEQSCEIILDLVGLGLLPAGYN